MAENKYKSLLRTGEWNVLSREQKENLALNAKLEKLTNKNKTNSEEANSKLNKRFEWKKIAPKDGSNTREMNETSYHWCRKHEMWMLLKPKVWKLEFSQRSPQAAARSFDSSDERSRVSGMNPKPLVWRNMGIFNLVGQKLQKEAWVIISIHFIVSTFINVSRLDQWFNFTSESMAFKNTKNTTKETKMKRI